MNILALCSDRQGSGFYRIFQPLEELRKKGHHTIITNAPNEDDAKADVVIAQRLFDDQSYQFLDMAKKEGAVLLYELDDLTFEIPEGHMMPVNNRYEGSYQSNVMAFMRSKLPEFDGYITTTNYLAEKIKRFIPNGIVFGNFLNREFFENTQPDADQNESMIRIGYTLGSPAHEPDLLSIEKVLRTILSDYPDVRLVIIGGYGKELFDRWPDALRPRVAYIAGDYLAANAEAQAALGFKPDDLLLFRIENGSATLGFNGKVAKCDNPLRDLFQSILNYYALIRNARLHIGIAPLLPSPFNQARSDLKLKEYRAFGIPVVVTGTEEYRRSLDWKTTDYARRYGVGYCADEAEEWRSYLRILLGTTETRLEMRKRAESNRILDCFYETPAGNRIDILERYLESRVREKQKA